MPRNTGISADDVRRVARQRVEASENGDGQKFNPFWAAINAAKKVTTRRPQDDQPEVWAEIEAAVGMLEEDEKRKAPWRLVIPVFNEEVHIAGLFALARACRMTAMAHAVAAIVKAKRAGGLTTAGLEQFGLVKTVVSDDGKRAWLQPHTGQEAISAAAKLMDEADLKEGARALRAYLNVASVNRATGIARREAAKANDGKGADEVSATETTDEGDADSNES
ncbi:MAG: hypothetical protein A3F94_01645 [Candidatus Spechtbacteria bacterium RIFCSPLOWO2_12_FULL_38_22]|uniref:Uncharacterized protein n=1 Tax=Candidatus Spechtbacteria bacterium RIFCSPLOWO2_12_FULL_38_22 TaxID=1802165 RepID=A0A1G2HJ70_9BACT|nr:MAG: hypothetical protein A3E58_02275 [Candidatus Spechtbacteria bacterium RIFCSPHIGHO2_12_FULL_38_30]OGZ62469.1 MAG: hypothetical protein A3F94_01645 [Candidatus Spechtbacteria bacterium RIFCSPLOWO2_12_FULL_38_22]